MAFPKACLISTVYIAAGGPVLVAAGSAFLLATAAAAGLLTYRQPEAGLDPSVQCSAQPLSLGSVARRPDNLVSWAPFGRICMLQMDIAV